MTALPVALAFGLSLAVGSAGEPDPAPGTERALIALAADLAEHPQSEAADLYKFLHQALFGPGHAIPDAAAAASFLRREIASLGPARDAEAWCAPLGGDPSLVRVNLRPFLANGFDSDRLLRAFVDTANRVEGDPAEFEIAVSLVTDWLHDEGRGELARGLQQLARDLRDEGYPAVHHSERYLAAYDPAYRVVGAAAASERGWCGRTFPG